MGYSKNETVVKSKPFALVIARTVLGVQDCHKNTCDFCFKQNPIQNEALKKCKGCQLCYYCDSDCHQRAWNSYHKKECKFLRKLYENDDEVNDAERLILRIFIKLFFFGGYEEYEELPNGKNVYYKDLMTNVDKIKSSIHGQICEFNHMNLKEAMGEN